MMRVLFVLFCLVCMFLMVEPVFSIRDAMSVESVIGY